MAGLEEEEALEAYLEEKKQAEDSLKRVRELVEKEFGRGPKRR